MYVRISFSCIQFHPFLSFYVENNLIFSLVFINIIASAREILTLLQAINKDAEQPVHPRSLVSTFDIRFLESTISTLVTGKNLISYLVSAAQLCGSILTRHRGYKTLTLFTEHVISIPYKRSNDGEKNPTFPARSISDVFLMLILIHARHL